MAQIVTIALTLRLQDIKDGFSCLGHHLADTEWRRLPSQSSHRSSRPEASKLARHA